MQNLTPKYMMQETERIKPRSHTDEVSLVNRVKVKIGMQLRHDKKKEMIRLLQENIHIFTESSNTVPGINRSIIEHHMEVDHKVKLVRQKCINYD